MKKTTKLTKRLNVNSEKVRPLTQDQLSQAAGGMTPTFISTGGTREGCHCDCSSYNCVY